MSLDRGSNRAPRLRSCTSTETAADERSCCRWPVAGIGGLGLGLDDQWSTELCEIDPGASAVLKSRFPGVEHHADITKLRSLPAATELVTAGFPCRNLSQAGRAAGIGGSRSGLVDEVFRLVCRKAGPRWLLIENVPFTLKLARGQAMCTSPLRWRRWATRGPDGSLTPARSACRCVATGSSCSLRATKTRGPCSSVTTPANPTRKTLTRTHAASRGPKEPADWVGRSTPSRPQGRIVGRDRQRARDPAPRRAARHFRASSMPNASKDSTRPLLLLHSHPQYEYSPTETKHTVLDAAVEHASTYRPRPEASEMIWRNSEGI